MINNETTLQQQQNDTEISITVQPSTLSKVHTA